MSDSGLDILLDDLKLNTVKRQYVAMAKEASETNKPMISF